MKRNVLKIIFFIVVLNCTILESFSQNKEKVETIPVERFILHHGGGNWTRDTWGRDLLDTKTGEVKFIYPDKNPEKIRIENYVGGPNIPESQSYNGRFSISYFDNGDNSFFILLDTKTGEIWHGRKRVITKVK